MNDDAHPELSQPSPDERPVRNPMMQRVLRIVIVIGVLALILPSVLSAFTTQSRTATLACTTIVNSLQLRGVTPVATIELFAPAGPGWYCVARDSDGTDTVLNYLGLIPGLSNLPEPGVPA
ncbi:hypothetical protein [uncultured Schumannella sp.]|uniref:hypothetical protein n=1 Tax=uncultured Schumannella sp. TaxID=1195956 RepID=UPI0025DD2E71|nr:hypothetical protein [uncultured Schumannella sp.]